MVCKEPNNSAGYGFSDDGEPSGTAGKPIFNVLSHQNIGQCGILVTRYFGGIKLGTGGLVKAYTSATKLGLENATLRMFEPKHTLDFIFPFSQESNFHYLCSQHEAEIVSVHYTHRVQASIKISKEHSANLLLVLSQNYHDIAPTP